MQLQVLTLLARKRSTPELSRLILDGRIGEAARHAEELLRDHEAQRAQSDSSPLEIALLCADLMLALDRAEEAEETYRIAVKFAHAGPRGTVRVVSCRSTGFLSLHQQRFGTASACFARLASDEAATQAQRVEALCALATASEGQGQRRAAQQAIDDAATLALASSDEDLIALVSLVRIELAARCEIRTHDLLHDHVFWRAWGTLNTPPNATGSALPSIARHLAAGDCPPLIAQRLAHLRDLLDGLRGQAPLPATTFTDTLARLREADLVALESQARIDIALVAIARRQPALARLALLPLQGREGAGRRGGSMEMAYCQAKICMLSDQVDAAMLHYQRYALESMECARAATVAADVAPPVAAARPESRHDDIEMRLPARYRRAYRYLQEHLDCAEMSVREIADSMGVTERALQNAFKTHLGMTPGEVVQRCRVERIRAELLREDACDPSVIATAARWGIRNRSTLIASYRKYFSETPTQTLARRVPATTGVPA